MHLPHLITASITSAALLTSASSVLAYDFAESCAPTTLHDSRQTQPDALIMLDNSCSMDNGAGNGKTKMEVSREVIGELADAVAKPGTCTSMNQSGCDDVFLGVGWFSILAGVDVKPGDDTATDIKNAVNGYPFKCQTQHGAAAKAIFNSNELATSDRVGVGIIVTDGAPYQRGSYGTTQDTVEETLHYLCAAKNRSTPVLTFMVGFGSGTNVKMNSLFAAAGGSGQCCIETTNGACTYQPDETFDPCTQLPRRNSTQLDATNFYAAGNKIKCKGDIQADNGQQLKSKLLALLDQAACTFPLDIPPNYVAGMGADEDPEATRVEFDHDILGSNIRVTAVDPGNITKFRDYLVTQRGVAPAVADQYIGEGWTFADPLRRTITLTNKLCQEVLSDNVEITETQVACLCPNTGSDCDVPCIDLDNDGYDDTQKGTACQDDGSGGSVQSGRCRPGIVECTVGVESCAQRFMSQPDICNGIDDDCDGNIDNSSRANPAYTSSDPDDSNGLDAFEWNENTSQLEAWNLSSGLFCGFQDFSCSCGISGGHDLDYQGMEVLNGPEREWRQLLSNTADQRDLCVCNAALESAEALPTLPSQAPEESADAEQGAACNAAPGSSPAPASLLLFLGLFAALFRRKKD